MKVEEIKKAYKGEWVVFRVLSTDAFDQPVDGEVIAHSQERDDIYKIQRGIKGDVCLVYSGEIPKEGYAVAFDG